jgi:hypothetical protein
VLHFVCELSSSILILPFNCPFYIHPFFLRWPFRFLRQERIRKGFFLAQARTRTYIAYQYKSEAQAKVVKYISSPGITKHLWARVGIEVDGLNKQCNRSRNFVKLVQMKRRIVAQIFSYEPQH